MKKANILPDMSEEVAIEIFLHKVDKINKIKDLFDKEVFYKSLLGYISCTANILIINYMKYLSIVQILLFVGLFFPFHYFWFQGMVRSFKLTKNQLIHERTAKLLNKEYSGIRNFIKIKCDESLLPAYTIDYYHNYGINQYVRSGLLLMFTVPFSIYIIWGIELLEYSKLTIILSMVYLLALNYFGILIFFKRFIKEKSFNYSKKYTF